MLTQNAKSYRETLCGNQNEHENLLYCQKKIENDRVNPILTVQDYPPKPEEDSGLLLLTVPKGNYYVRVFSGRGGVHQVRFLNYENATFRN